MSKKVLEEFLTNATTPDNEVVQKAQEFFNEMKRNQPQQFLTQLILYIKENPSSNITNMAIIIIYEILKPSQEYTYPQIKEFWQNLNEEIQNMLVELCLNSLSNQFESFLNHSSIILGMILDYEYSHSEETFKSLYDIISRDEYAIDIKINVLKMVQTICEYTNKIPIQFITSFHDFFASLLQNSEINIDNVIIILRTLLRIYSLNLDLYNTTEELDNFLKFSFLWLVEAAKLNSESYLCEILQIDLQIFKQAYLTNHFPSDAFNNIIHNALTSGNELVINQVLHMLIEMTNHVFSIKKKSDVYALYNKSLTQRMGRSQRLIKKFYIEEINFGDFMLNLISNDFEVLFSILSTADFTSDFLDEENYPNYYLVILIFEKIIQIYPTFRLLLIAKLQNEINLEDFKASFIETSILFILSSTNNINQIFNEKIEFLYQIVSSTSLLMRELSLSALNNLNFKTINSIDLTIISNLVKEQLGTDPKLASLAVNLFLNIIKQKDNLLKDSSNNIIESNASIALDLFQIIYQSADLSIKSLVIEILENIFYFLSTNIINEILTTTFKQLKPFLTPGLELSQDEIIEKNYLLNISKTIIKMSLSQENTKIVEKFIMKIISFCDFDTNDLVLDFLRWNKLDVDIFEHANICLNSGDPNLVMQGTSFAAYFLYISGDFEKSLDVLAMISQPLLNQECRMDQVPILLKSLIIFLRAFLFRKEMISDDAIDMILNTFGVIYEKFDFNEDENLVVQTFSLVFQCFELLIQVNTNLFHLKYRLFLKFADKIVEFSVFAKEAIISYISFILECCKHINSNQERVTLSKKNCIFPLLIASEYDADKVDYVLCKLFESRSSASD